MNKIFNFIIQLLLSIFIIIFILFNVAEFSISNKNASIYFKHSSYAANVYNVFKNDLDSIIFDESIKNEYLKFYDVKLIKSDLVKYINNKSINHNSSLEIILKNNISDTDKIKQQNEKVYEVYKSNMFIKSEYKKLHNKFLLDSNNILFINIILITSITLLFTYLYFKNKDLIKQSLLNVASTFILVFVIIKYTFRNMYYINDYYTNFLKYIINFNAYIYISISLVIGIIFLVLYLKKIKRR